MRDRVVDAAIRVTTERGWAKVTMSRLADDVGVSRQTVYNEVGSKNDLAEAMVDEEVEVREVHGAERCVELVAPVPHYPPAYDGQVMASTIVCHERRLGCEGTVDRLEDLVDQRPI